MVEPVVESNACNRDPGAGHVGEIRQSHASGYVDLPEDDLLLLAMDSAQERIRRSIVRRMPAPSSASRLIISSKMRIAAPELLLKIVSLHQ